MRSQALEQLIDCKFVLDEYLTAPDIMEEEELVDRLSFLLSSQELKRISDNEQV